MIGAATIPNAVPRPAHNAMRRAVHGPVRGVLGRVAVVVAGLAVLAGCGSGGGQASNPSPAPVPGAIQGGKLSIGIAFDQPGLGLKTGNSYTGFDVDTAVYIAAALGVPRQNITWKEANSSQRQELLQTGQADLIVSTFSITPERQQQIDFAGPYFIAHQDLLVRRNDTEITGPDTLDGKNLCSVPGTTSAAYVTSHYLGNIKLIERPRFSDCVTALANSEVDAVTTDDVILAGFAAEPQYQGKLKVVGKGFSDEVYGIGIKKGDTALVDKVNAALKEYINDGSWKKSLDINVRPSGYSIPNPPTPAAT
jgi:glutamate transport system substrate-binding protein